MAAVITQWEQAAMFDPTNPNQIVHTRYTGIPGGYGSFYYNKVPTTATLLGVSPSTWPAWGQALAVAVVGVAAGYFGIKKFGGSLPVSIRSKLGLSGARKRRR